jgi:membrane-bound metal-dependent hydrolase YbcI (DUF457 family)
VPLAETEENKSFAVGHLALGYISSKASAKLLKTELNIPLILTLSILPDIDILIPFLTHRGPTHSALVTFVVFLPLFAVFHKNAIPYFLALLQHSLISDYIVGSQIQLLWPLTTGYYGMEIGIKTQTNMAIEWIAFLTATIVMFKAKDLVTLFQPRNSNLILTIPTFTVLLPTFLAFPLEVPPILMLPHIVYLILFLTSILIDVRKILTNSACKPSTKSTNN